MLLLLVRIILILILLVSPLLAIGTMWAWMAPFPVTNRNLQRYVWPVLLLANGLVAFYSLRALGLL